MLKASLSFFICAACFLSTAFATVRVTNLYHVELPVAAQTHDIREKAVKEAFTEVLTKLTGNIDILQTPVIKENLSRANYFVQEYNYAATSTNAYNYSLNVYFQKEDIDQLVKASNVPFWGENRPLILVWLIVNNGISHEVISSENQAAFSNAMLNQSKKMGLPLLFPMMDVADISTIGTEDIEEMNREKLTNAAKRYGVDGILIGNIERTKLNFQSRWQLVIGDQEWGWKIDKNNEYELGAAIINNVSQSITKKFQNSAREEFTLIIDNVNQPGDLINLMKFLRQMPEVKDTQVSKVTRDSVELNVSIREIEAFQQEVAQAKKLALKSQEPTANRYIYEWVH